MKRTGADKKVLFFSGLTAVFGVYPSQMEAEQVIQGRRIGSPDIALVHTLLAANPSWHRTRLSRELCERWDWRNAAGRLKDMACRTLLLKLERRGEIRLPVRQSTSTNTFRNRNPAEVPHDQSPIESDLNVLRPLRIKPLLEQDLELALFKFLLHRYHYLGHRNTVGENFRYLVRDRHGRLLACLLFGSAAWKAKARDEFIGWDAVGRQRNLLVLTNNTRFLILPWVRVPHLASHLLAKVCARLSTDWTAKYGHPIHLLETFVERQRFRGICYRAAGWIHVGATAGRSRNDVKATLHVPIKDVYLKPLTADFRRRLCV